MVLIRECDDSGKVIDPTDHAERGRLRNDCLRHATRPNGVIDWEVYNLGLYGEILLSDLSSDTKDSSGKDSDCVYLSATSGTDHKEDVSQEIRSFQEPSSKLKSEESQPSSREMMCFS